MIANTPFFRFNTDCLHLPQIHKRSSPMTIFPFFFKKVSIPPFYTIENPSSAESFANYLETGPPSPQATPFEKSILRTALRETITTLEKKFDISLIPLGSTMMSLWRALDAGSTSRHKAILLVGFSTTEEKEIASALKNVLKLWHEHAQTHNIPIGLATHKKGQLTPITQKEETRIHRQKGRLNTLAKYSEVGALLGIIFLANVFNDSRIFHPKGSLGKEYGDDNYILKHVTFTQFDLLILALLPTFALVAKNWYLQTWSSPIVHSTTDLPYAEVRDPKTEHLTGSDRMAGAFHRAHGGILWIGKETIANQACRNLLRTGLTLGHYETPQGNVPNAFLTIVSTTALSEMGGTENDGRFTVISRTAVTPQASVVTTTRQRNPARSRRESLGEATHLSLFMSNKEKVKRDFLKEFREPYLNYKEYPSLDRWQSLHNKITEFKEKNPLVFITGLDTLIDTLFTQVENRDKNAPYFLLLSGPYGAAKTTIGQEIAKLLARQTQKPEQTYYALETQGGSLSLTCNPSPYTENTNHLTIRKIAYGMGAGMATMFFIVNVAVSDNYHNKGVSFQDGLDRLQFAWMLLVAWVGLLGMVAKAGYQLSQTHDNPQNLIMDFSTDNTVGAANEDLSVNELAGKEIATTGFPHNRFSFDGALMLRHAGLFAENWDAIPAEPKRKILDSIRSGQTQIPTRESVPTRAQFLVATTNHPETNNLSPFDHHAFSLIAPWQKQDDMMIVANIILNTEPHTPHWDTNALTRFLDFCRNEETEKAVLTRQILVDMAREIGNLAYYLDKDIVGPESVEQVWKDRVFEGPLADIREAYNEVHGIR